MKAAMWGIGLFVMGLLGLVLINLFGNITVTNQFNYTTMKNAVQAAMLDSLDIAHYRAGFCLCNKDGSPINKNALKSFSDKNQYEFRDITNDKCLNQNGEELNSCVSLYGEYRLNKEKFEEIFQERFRKVTTNNKEYQYIIKEIIEYPPKVSVMVISKDEEFFPTDKDAGGYNIVNQIDAIIETNKEVVINYVDVEEPEEEPQEETPATDQYTVTIHHYIEGTTTKVHYDNKMIKNKGDAYVTKYVDTSALDSAYKNKYEWNGKTPSNAKGTIGNSDITVTYYYKVKKATSTSSSCGYHYYVTSVTCKQPVYEYKTVQGQCTGDWTYNRTYAGLTECKKLKSTKDVKVSVSLASAPGSSATANDAVDKCNTAAKNKCTSSGYTGMSTSNCQAVRNYTCTVNGIQVPATNRTSAPYEDCVCLG